MHTKVLWLICLLFPAVLVCQASEPDKTLDATLDICRYKIDSTYAQLEIYLNIDAHTAHLQPQASGYKAVVEVVLTILQQDSMVIVDSFTVHSPIIAHNDVPAGSFFSIKRSLLVKEGDYSLTLTAHDVASQNHKNDIEAELPLSVYFPNNKIAFSDIRLLESYQKSENTASPVYRGGYELMPSVDNFYPESRNKVQFYAEIYNTSEVLGVDEPYVLKYKITREQGYEAINGLGRTIKMKATESGSIISQIDLTTLPSGNYELFLELRDRDNRLRAVGRKFFQRSNPSVSATATDELPIRGFALNVPDADLARHIAALMPIANQDEQKYVDILKDEKDYDLQRRFLYNFWKKRNELHPERDFADYASRLRLAEQKYAAPGLAPHETDRGRVLLQYGKPNRIETEMTESGRSALDAAAVVPFEIWHYYTTPWLNQQAVFIVFVQENMGDNNYRLAHSNALGEIVNYAWRENIEDGGRHSQMRTDDTYNDPFINRNQNQWR